MSVLDDLDLEPPIKTRRLLVETYTTYEVWVDDDNDKGAVALAARLTEDGDSHELFRDGSPVDGGFSWHAPDGGWEPHAERTEHGPWRLCPWPDCKRPQYPWYGADPVCGTHSVIGCQFRHLPEKTTW